MKLNRNLAIYTNFYFERIQISAAAIKINGKENEEITNGKYKAKVFRSD